MAGPKPNILIIHADQHRYDCIGAYGNDDIRTPNIDALADDGVRYLNSFCPYPVCTPSRYSLLTGLYVHQHLGWTNRSTLPGGVATFPKMLRDSGYATRAVGKMHFTPTYLDVGFDTMFLAEQDGNGRFDDDYHRWLRDEGLIDRIDLMDQRKEYREEATDEYWQNVGALTSDLDEPHHSTTWIADRAAETIEGWGEGGNLLMVGFIKPHHPFDPPDPWSSMYDPEGVSLLPGWLEAPLDRDISRHAGYFPHADLTESQFRLVMTHYYATISQIDFHVGRLVELLRNRDLYEDTLIIYTSDHGDYMGYHHLLLKGNHMYDPLAKVPLIAKFPAAAARTGVSEALVSNVDLAPTILETAGLEVPGHMAGVSLLKADPEREFVFAESGGTIHRKQYMARSRSAKLLECEDRDISLFFDLERDPEELVNLVDDPGYSEAVADHRDALARWSLFDAPSRSHLDYNAPTIDSGNVPENTEQSAKSMEQYFKDRF